MNLNLSKFKKLECDEKSTTLAHPRGHTIKIAHVGLSPEMQKQLQELPDSYAKGGKVENKFSPKMDASKPAKSSNTMPGSPTEAKNAYTEPNAMGTSIPKQLLKEEMRDHHYPDVVLGALNRTAPPFGPLGAEPEHHSPPCINSSCKSYGKSHPNCRCYGGKMGMYGGYAEGGKVEDEKFCDANRTHFKGCEYLAHGSEEPLSVDLSPEDIDPKAPINPNLDRLTSLQKEMAQAKAQQQPSQEQSLMALANNGNSAKAASDIPPQMPAQNAPMAPQEDSSQPEEMPTAAPPMEAPKSAAPMVSPSVEHASNVANNLMNEDQAVKNDLAQGYIKPEHYEDLFGHGTLGKISTMFGLMLSGAGSGLAHQPNMLMEMMNNTIQNDLKAKEASASAMQNVRATTANVRKANAESAQQELATKNIIANRFALDHLIKSTANIPANSPQGMKRDQFLSILAPMVDKENATIASKAGLAEALTNFGFGANGQGSNTQAMKSGLLGEPMAKMGADIEEKSIPGVPGQANRPIPQDARNQALAMTVLDNKGKDLLNYVKSHKGTWNPQTRAIATQKIEEMKNFYNGSISGGALTQGRLGWYDEQFAKHPTDILPQIMGSTAKLEEMVNSNSMRKNSLLNSLGFKTKQGGNKSFQNSQGIQEGTKAVNKQTGQTLIFRNGRWQ